MKLLLALFRFVFGCRHRHLSRVFAIKHRTRGQFHLRGQNAEAFGLMPMPIDGEINPARHFGQLP